MSYKCRTESKELQALKLLNTRMDLSAKDKQHYLNLKKGFEGERRFDRQTETLQCECLILNDLLLKVSNTVFQIDSLLICSETIYLYEVKNYDGDYVYELDRFYTRNKTEIINPLHQLKRSESLLRQLLDKLGYNIPINSSVVFINPEFTLYQAPITIPFIFPTQINRHIEKLNMISSKINAKHKMLADKLVSLHLEDAPYYQLPSYNYERMRKGISCVKCSSLTTFVEGMKCFCKECGEEELVSDSVMRSVRELHLLFSNQKISTNKVYDWCKVITSKKRISRILEKNLKVRNVRRWSYYE
ncbi:nuclease-related domain-containing protein [Mesobacillus maritimus]|uniref:NERD domain-containing protein n=1 Tax=Mesobacillus maritimus TaxID=1643336 RepID=A0ABS7K3R7_9BACI|nr:nuclease-related domain-containing protein [Mesobacillus maritimus]MBY0096902.1 NERD domain-containing protein [Mesobacillus maritimus]